MFDETAVLDAATHEFRVHGFADTSTGQLCEAAGVGRSTLYNTFTSKEELFVRALEHYLETTSAAHATILEDEALDGMARLRALLDLVLEEEAAAARKGHAAGCMVVGTRMTPDMAGRDERVKQLLDRGLGHQLAALAAVVRQGQVDGSITKKNTPQDAAQLVISLISGIRVMAQAGTTTEDLRTVASLGLTALRS
ncbi:MAG: TetR/AcrR family transcriptional regulator [Arachnia propionica]|uniref:TetR/AcrR family transcriptional regulator n=1 Tax=Arachnia propionica TaxID=1750 RepID=UPI00270829C8|nr:TetR/AcrR family transcriptional regulator [Arachnia propionica]